MASSDERINQTYQQRACAALQWAFVGDALAMPVHWYYRTSDILKEFPPTGIEKFEPAPASHPGSIMALHDTRGGGRRRAREPDTPREDLVGKHILKDKVALWNKPGVHYHHGLPAGENTLNAYGARWLLQLITNNNAYTSAAWLDEYVTRMTSIEAQHPDTYAESYHRAFFANQLAGRPLSQCAAVTHDTPSIGVLVTVLPLALTLLADASIDDAIASCQNHARLTHPHEDVDAVVGAFVTLLDNLLRHPQSVDQQAWNEAARVVRHGDISRELAGDLPVSQVLGVRFSTACYLDGAWPSVCYLAARYAQNPWQALLTNTNAGGDNVHRGFVLGSLLGALSGETPSMFNQLQHSEALQQEFNSWAAQIS